MNGHDLGALIRAEAARRGQSITAFFRPVTSNGASLLASIEAADQPRQSTIDRVRSLLDRKLLLDAIEQEVRDAPPRRRAARATIVTDAPVPPPRAVDRTPCFRCGIRADIGCACAQSARRPDYPYTLAGIGSALL